MWTIVCRSVSICDMVSEIHDIRDTFSLMLVCTGLAEQIQVVRVHGLTYRL